MGSHPSPRQQDQPFAAGNSSAKVQHSSDLHRAVRNMRRAGQMARYVARLIDDRSTLQVGLGRVPNEMQAHLTNRRGLAIHSDVLTDPVVDLVAAGVVTGPVTASWAMGTRRLHDLVDNNPRFAFHPVEYVSDPAVISRNDRMVSVTQAFTIDLTGQVCTESLDGELYGGVSSGPAFHRGALASPGGLSIVCLASRTPQGLSAICTDLGPAEPVAIPRAAGYGLVLVIALAAASWTPGLWRLIPMVVFLVLLVLLSPRLSRGFRDR